MGLLIGKPSEFAIELSDDVLIDYGIALRQNIDARFDGLNVSHRPFLQDDLDEMAGSVGFEPTGLLDPAVFKTAVINRSTNSPDN